MRKLLCDARSAAHQLYGHETTEFDNAMGNVRCFTQSAASSYPDGRGGSDFGLEIFRKPTELFVISSATKGLRTPIRVKKYSALSTDTPHHALDLVVVVVPRLVKAPEPQFSE